MKQVSLKVGQYDLAVSVSEMSPDARIAVRPLCEALGLNWMGQSTRLRNNPQFSCMAIHTTGADGKQYEMLTIPVKQIGMFLCTINARRVKPEIQEKLIQFQTDLQVVIHDALTGRVSAKVVARLVQQIEMMAAQIARQESRIAQLEAEQRAAGILSASDTRAAAIRLSAQRWANESGMKIH